MSKFILSLVIVFSTLNIFSSCNKNKDENIDLYFEVPLNITPVKDTIKLGDSLFLQANFPDSIKEVTTRKNYKLANFDFKTSIAFSKLASTDLFLSQQPGNTSSYTIVNREGIINNLSETFGDLSFLYIPQSYHLYIILIPKKTGVFNIFFFSKYLKESIRLDSLNLGSSSTGGKKIGYLRDIHYIINNGNNNYELLKKNSKLSSVVNPSTENIREEQQSAFTFVVK